MEAARRKIEEAEKAWQQDQERVRQRRQAELAEFSSQVRGHRQHVSSPSSTVGSESSRNAQEMLPAAAAHTPPAVGKVPGQSTDQGAQALVASAPET
eukprot:5772662-Prymnesium_polylepis.1